MDPAIEAAEADIEKGVEAWIAETDGKDLDEAIEIAAKHPLAGLGAMELRPFGAD